MRGQLPVFRKVQRRYAAALIHSALSGPGGSALLELREYEDRHFRVIFRRSYFQLKPEQNAPSKSQWSTLKKKLKRRNRTVFVFRDYGEIDCGHRDATAPCCYLDFGFMAD